ncbi:hypothetical protein AC1031_005260 [Aphanomyces cochlioides]|nr:hypothetical protein AC1031_005260 [Aphanomyces cochlioides]
MQNAGNAKSRLQAKTWDYYVCLACVVLPMRAITILTPLALLLLSLNQLHLFGTPLDAWYATPLFLYCASEALFTIYFYDTKAKLSQLVNLSPPRIVDTYAERRHPHTSVPTFFDTLAVHVGDVRGWLQDVRHSSFLATDLGLVVPRHAIRSVTRQDLRAWLSFALISKQWEDLTHSEANDVDIVIEKIHASLGTTDRCADQERFRQIDEMANELYHTKSSSRSASTITSMNAFINTITATHQNLQPSEATKPCTRHLFDPINARSRPWLCYTLTLGLDWIGALVLYMNGFERHAEIEGYSYWHRPALTEETQEPIVFVHGAGTGLAMYARLLLRLFARFKNRQILLPEMPEISMQLSTDNVLPRDELLWCYATMLEQHGIASAHWMGHSLGTVPCSWVAQDMPRLVSHVTMIDPIVFGLWPTDVCFNFLYRHPLKQASNGPQLVLWYFFSMELGIAHVLRRHFYWYDNLCFPENLPRHPTTNNVATTVFLSSHDQVINAPAVYAYLQRGAKLGADAVAAEDWIETTMWPGFHRGQMLLHKSAQEDILRSLQARGPKVVQTPTGFKRCYSLRRTTSSSPSKKAVSIGKRDVRLVKAASTANDHLRRHVSILKTQTSAPEKAMSVPSSAAKPPNERMLLRRASQMYTKRDSGVISALPTSLEPPPPMLRLRVVKLTQ